MSDPLQSLKPGDGLPTSIRTWNPVLAAARAHPTTAQPSAGKSKRQPRGDVRIKNTTGAALDRGAVLYVDPDDDPILTPTNAPNQFKNTIVLAGSKFASDKLHPNRAFVLAAPASIDGIVGCYATGIVAAEINVHSADDTTVTYHPDQTRFYSAGHNWPLTSGGWPIVWKESGTGLKWAYVDLTAQVPRQAFAQAPSGGIPARIGMEPGEADCEIIAFYKGTLTPGSTNGSFVKTGHSITVKNWATKVVGSDGDRIIQIESEHQGAFIVGFDCENNLDPADLEAMPES